jgi:hypothetical protein
VLDVEQWAELRRELGKSVSPDRIFGRGYPRRLAKRLNSSGPLTTARAHDLHAALADRFPQAQ